MGVLSNIFKPRDKPENRTAGSAYTFYMGGTTSGKAVTERSAMQMTAVYSCVRILAEAVAGLPLHLYKYNDDGGKEKAIDHPLYRLLHDVPDRYFMARLNDAVDCERLVRSAGSFDLKFFCPDPFGYAITDETFSITEEGIHTITRSIGNIESLPVYRISGVITAGASNYISITTNGSELKIVNVTLSEGETLVVDTDKMSAYVVDENGGTLRNGLPYLQELNFPTLAVGENTVTVEVSNATLTELQIQAKPTCR